MPRTVTVNCRQDPSVNTWKQAGVGAAMVFLALRKIGDRYTQRVCRQSFDETSSISIHIYFNPHPQSFTAKRQTNYHPNIPTLAISTDSLDMPNLNAD